MQQKMQVSTPFHFDSMIHDQVSEQDHSNVTPAKRSGNEPGDTVVINILLSLSSLLYSIQYNIR